MSTVRRCVVDRHGDGGATDDVHAPGTPRLQPLIQEPEQALNLPALEPDQSSRSDQITLGGVDAALRQPVWRRRANLGLVEQADSAEPTHRPASSRLLSASAQRGGSRSAASNSCVGQRSQ